MAHLPSLPPSGGSPEIEALNQLTIQLYEMNSNLETLNSNITEINQFNVQFWQFDPQTFSLGFSSVIIMFVISYTIGLIFATLKIARRSA